MANAGKLSEGQRRFVRQAWISAVLVALLVTALAGTRAVTWLENGTYDARVRWSADTRKADPSIVIIDVDNPSLGSAFQGKQVHRVIRTAPTLEREEKKCGGSPLRLALGYHVPHKSRRRVAWPDGSG